MAEVKTGLQNVVIATSEICSIDGQQGRLIYRGYEIGDLAGHASFEEVVYLLWYGRLPNRTELDELKKQFAENQVKKTYLAIVRGFTEDGNIARNLQYTDGKMLSGKPVGKVN